MSEVMVQRCKWAESDPQMRQYHDAEWGVPVHDGRLLWETLMLEGFQAGLSWAIILRKREGFRRAFAAFDPVRVAAFDESDVARLMADPGIVRARAKIAATISGARIYLEMAERGEDFAEFCWSFTGGKTLSGAGRQTVSEESTRMARELKRRGFKFCGPVIVYAWMQAVGMVDDHMLGCFRRA